MSDSSTFEFAKRESIDFVGDPEGYEKRRIQNIPELARIADRESKIRHYIRSALGALRPHHPSNTDWIKPDKSTHVFHARDDADYLTTLESTCYNEVLNWLLQHKGKIFTRPFTLFQLDPKASQISGQHLSRAIHGENIVSHEKQHASADKHLSDGGNGYVALKLSLLPHGDKSEFEVQGRYTNCVGANYRYKDRMRIRMAPEYPSYEDISGAQKAINYAYPPYVDADKPRNMLKAFVNQKKPFDLGTIDTQLSKLWLLQHPEIDSAIFQK